MKKTLLALTAASVCFLLIAGSTVAVAAAEAPQGKAGFVAAETEYENVQGNSGDSFVIEVDGYVILDEGPSPAPPIDPVPPIVPPKPGDTPGGGAADTPGAGKANASGADTVTRSAVKTLSGSGAAHAKGDTAGKDASGIAGKPDNADGKGAHGRDASGPLVKLEIAAVIVLLLFLCLLLLVWAKKKWDRDRRKHTGKM
ncbi:MAG: hypothetical protein LBK04_07695 [Clostridiales Family XIII bacterium]|nr:hypothetical protein [Clostridiales Family XIII bacterium]